MTRLTDEQLLGVTRRVRRRTARCTITLGDGLTFDGRVTDLVVGGGRPGSVSLKVRAQCEAADEGPLGEWPARTAPDDGEGAGRGR